ncbi:MAG: tetratricopeptide repeat protein [Anaerolineales bacterium]|nr:MAG: tetratricopeptide repeat protein [Anaerolineales bacterium]
MLSRLGDWFLEIVSLPERRRFLQESSVRLADYYHNFAIRNKDIPDAMEDEFKDVIHAAELLLKRRKWDQLIGLAEALSAFMQERGYWDDALWLYSAALDGVEKRLLRIFQPPLPLDWNRKISLLTKLGSISVQQGYFQEAEQYLAHAMQTAELIQNKNLQAQISNILASLSRLQGQPEKSQEYVLQSKRLLPDVSTQLSSEYLQLISQGNFNEAKRGALAQLEMARQNKDRKAEAETLCNLGALAVREGNQSEALSAYQQAIAICSANQYQDEEQGACHGMAKALAAFGRLAEGNQILDQVMDFSARKGSQSAILDVLIDQGGIYVDLKEFGPAEECFQQAMKIAIHLESVSQLAICFFQLGSLCSKRDDLDGAIRNYEQFLQAAEESQHQQMIEIACESLAMALLQKGSYEEARLPLNRRLEISRSLHWKPEEAFTLYLLGVMETKLASYANAESLFQQSIALYNNLGNIIGAGRGLYSLSEIYFDQEQFILSWGCMAQLIPLVNPSNREELLSLTLLGLDRFAEVPQYREQAIMLRNSLAIVELDGGQ